MEEQPPPPQHPNEHPVSIQDEMRTSYLDYAMSVIIGRAIPDVRDGLKPVHRRILYAMRGLNLAPGGSYRKCALVVGEVLGSFHPHGDASVYDALVRMAQSFSMRHMLIDGQGNRSEERRVGKECRSRWSPAHEKKKHKTGYDDQ